MLLIILFFVVNFSLVSYGIWSVSKTPYSKKDKKFLYSLILLLPIIGLMYHFSQEKKLDIKI